MIRATTPTHTFTLPFETDQIKSLLISYGQHNHKLLDKRKEDCRLNGKEVIVRLTQEEANLFYTDLPVDIQMRILTVAGDALASEIRTVPYERVINDEVLK